MVNVKSIHNVKLSRKDCKKITYVTFLVQGKKNAFATPVLQGF